MKIELVAIAVGGAVFAKRWSPSSSCFGALKVLASSIEVFLVLVPCPSSFSVQFYQL